MGFTVVCQVESTAVLATVGTQCDASLLLCSALHDDRLLQGCVAALPDALAASLLGSKGRPPVKLRCGRSPLCSLGTGEGLSAPSINDHVVPDALPYGDAVAFGATGSTFLHVGVLETPPNVPHESRH